MVIADNLAFTMLSFGIYMINTYFVPDETETIYSMGINVGQHNHVDCICSASSSSPGNPLLAA